MGFLFSEIPLLCFRVEEFNPLPIGHRLEFLGFK